MANTKITTNVIADDAVTSDKLGGDLTMPGHISLADNKELRIGTGNDFVIKHDTNHTTLTNTTGNFTLLGDAVYIGNAANNEYMAQFVANGAASLRYDNTEQLATVSGGVYIPNKLGIGTNAPARLPLHIHNSTDNADSNIHLTSNETGSSSSDGFTIAVSPGGANDGSVALIQRENASIKFYTNATQVMELNSGGDLGVGTINPLLKVTAVDSGVGGTSTSGNVGVTHGNGSIPIGAHNENNSATYSAIALETRTSGASRWLIANEWTATYLGDLAFHRRTGGSSSAEAMRITSAGNVGIGTSSPSTTYNKQLHINASGTGASLKLTDSGSGTGASDGAEVIMYNTNMYVTNREAANMFLQTSANTQVTIDSGGNVALANGNLAFSTAGKGIDFGATAGPTHTGAGSSELLNDYEQGTWTPTVESYQGNSVSTGGTFSGWYIKIGQQVTCVLKGDNFTFTGSYGTDLVGITLPFNPTAGIEGGGGCAFHGLSSGGMHLMPLIISSGNALVGFIGSNNNNGSWGWTTFNHVGSGNTSFRAQFTYLL